MEAALRVELDQLVSAGQFELAAKRLHPFIVEAENRGRQDPELLREAGMLSVGLLDFHGAMVFLDAAIRAGDRELVTVCMLADVTHHLKCPQVVIDHISRCAHPVVASRWARTLATLFRFRDAETVIAQMENPDDDPIVAEVRSMVAVSRFAPDRLEIAENAAARFPSIAQIWGQLATARQSFGDTEGACEAYRQALKIEPYFAPWHYNYALSLLSAGDYRAGFREYEWRLHADVERKLKSKLPNNPAGVPLWRGESLDGKTLVMYMEGGLGDCILALRLIPLLLGEKLRELKVIVPKPLLKLCARTWPTVPFVVVPTIEDYQGSDYWVPSLSVPDKLGLAFSRLPAREGYFQADTERVEYWREKLAALKKHFGKAKSCALVWHGRVEHDYEKTRAFTAQEFRRMLAEDVLPVIIQLEATPDELAQFADIGDPQKLWVGPHIACFEDTAAILVACDEHLLCDTSTAHLAAALGLQANILIKNQFVWQWKCLPNGQAAWYSQPKLVFVDDGRTEEIVYMIPEERSVA